MIPKKTLDAWRKKFRATWPKEIIDRIDDAIEKAKIAAAEKEKLEEPIAP